MARLLALTFALGCSAGTLDSATFQREFGVSHVRSIPEAGEDNFEAGTIGRLLEELREATGSADPEVGDIVVMPDTITFVVRDAKTPKNLDVYVVRAGHVDPPRPETRDLTTAPLSTLVALLERVPDLVALAREGSSFGPNHVNSIGIDSTGAAFVNLSDMRDNAHVRFDAAGKRLP